MAAPPLSPARARMWFAVADALLPPAPGAVGFDWMPGLGAALGRRGPAARRRLARLLLWLDWLPWWTLRGGRFWQLPRPERAALLARRARRGRGAAGRRFLEALLAEAGPPPAGETSTPEVPTPARDDQSASGA